MKVSSPKAVVAGISFVAELAVSPMFDPYEATSAGEVLSVGNHVVITTAISVTKAKAEVVIVDHWAM